MIPDLARDLAVTGIGAATTGADPTAFLRQRKLRKFMGLQDDMAVTAAAQALQSAGITGSLGDRCGLYMAVGYIPFETADINRLLDASLEDGRFSMRRFAVDGFGAINPLLTFRVLPNMPAFHVSLNFDLQGPYCVSYPGAGQFYAALEEAFAALQSGAIDMALVGAVADQENGLVEHHFSRLAPPVHPSRLSNAAAFLVVERHADSIRRGAPARATLVDYRFEYAPADPFEGAPASECLARDGVCLNDPRHLGPVSLASALAHTSAARLTHALQTSDGFRAASAWEVA